MHLRSRKTLPNAILRVACLQLAFSSATRPSLLATVAAEAEAVAYAGASVLVLPELFAWPYFANSDPKIWQEQAERQDGALVSWARTLAYKTRLTILMPLFLQDDAGYRRNAVLSVRPDADTIIVAQKMHFPPAHGARWSEADHFAPGESQLLVFDINGFAACVLICYDRRFPECWRAAREAGADIVFVPVAGPADEAPDFFAAELRTHARENGVWAVSACRAGTDLVDDVLIEHNGDTLIVAPDGEIVASLNQMQGHGVVCADISRARLKECRQRFPFFEQRRPISAVQMRSI